jgi:hypothetical protein
VSLRVLDALESNNHDVGKFELTDDLQAMFFIFIWICILYTGPNGSQRGPSPNNKRLLTYEWSEGAGGLTEDGVKLANRSKRAFINDLVGEGDINRQFTPYFATLIPVAKEWRILVRDDEQERQLAANENRVSKQYLTHEAIIDILSRALDSLPDRELFSLKHRMEDTSIKRGKKRRMSLG